MAHDAAPNLVVMRIAPPSYQCVAWPILDVSDALVSLEKDTVDVSKPTIFSPTLTLPQYVNDVFVGETLNLVVLLSNRHKVTFMNIIFKVHIVIDGVEGEPIVLEPFSGITLEPCKKPHTTTISHTFKHPSQHNMTFTVSFNVGKKSYQVVKRAVWNAANPLKFDFVQEKDSNGRTHIEALVTNVSKLVLTIRDMKLLNPNDSTLQDCIYNKNDELNAICVLTPNATYSVIYRDIDTSMKLCLKTFWYCYQRGSGDLITPIEVADHLPVIAYMVLQHPGTVKSKEQFTVVLKIKNMHVEPLKCSIKFNKMHLSNIIVQIDDYLDLGILNNLEERVVEVPLMCLSTGLHVISGMEIHSDHHEVVPIAKLEVLAM
ncbi:hypothetical protein X943_001463 [Babesia divergens]|uniref:Uncharacterized protein n=1 Tax=Babesia divergens TaxID=32595 RepID=A0AAD9GHS4_BABDI|nr:hypothetical protein X943_001463 [Babesia divergens]